MISGDEAISEIGISVPQVRGRESTEGFWESEMGQRVRGLSYLYLFNRIYRTRFTTS